MSSGVQITDLKELLGLPETTQIIAQETDNLTSAFENYGSLMLRLKVKTINKDQQEEVLNLVCKLYPTTKEWQDMFRIDQTFKKEAEMYTDFIPEMESFQRELNIGKEDQLDVFIKCHGARVQKHTEDKVIEAALILDNLKLQGYQMGSRRNGFDSDHVEFVLSRLAQFHGVPIALKMKKPELFEEKLMPLINKVDLHEGWAPGALDGVKEMFRKYYQGIPEICHLTERIMKQYEFCIENNANMTIPKDIFNSICHNDFWVNNMMISYDQDDPKPKRLKILDFQLTKFAPVALDLIFFLFTSVDLDTLSTSIDKFIRYYYDELIRVLRIHSCPVDEFTFDRFLSSMKRAAIGELHHLTLLFRVIHLDESKLTKAEKEGNNAIMRIDIVGEEFYRKLKLVILEYEKRGWLME